jgi:hypothetical protein
MMRSRQRLVLVSLALGVCAAYVSAQAPLDFSGKWLLEPGQGTARGGGRGTGAGGGNSTGGGLALGPSATEMTIAQDAATLTVQQHGSRVSKLVYRLDGRESRNTLSLGDRTRSATFVSRWQNGRLVTTITTTSARGARLVLQEQRYLDDAGRMVVETGDPQAGNARRVVYRREQ